MLRIIAITKIPLPLVCVTHAMVIESVMVHDMAAGVGYDRKISLAINGLVQNNGFAKKMEAVCHRVIVENIQAYQVFAGSFILVYGILLEGNAAITEIPFPVTDVAARMVGEGHLKSLFRVYFISKGCFAVHGIGYEYDFRNGIET